MEAPPDKPSDETTALDDTLTATSEETPSQRTQVNCAQIPDPRNSNKCMLLYAAKFWGNLLYSHRQLNTTHRHHFLELFHPFLLLPPLPPTPLRPKGEFTVSSSSPPRGIA